MYCEPCRRERPHHSRFCVLCGNPLVQRPIEEIETELTHVRWLLTEVIRWDNSLAPAPARLTLAEFYRSQETLLVQAVSAQQRAARGEVEPTPSIAPPRPTVPVAPPPPIAEPSVVVEPEPQVADAVPPPPRVLPPPPPPRRPPGPSAWERFWKPLLGESIGWFIGAFLILAGTFTFVVDAWRTMSQAEQAMTVFGLAVFWTLGFGGWAKMLARREATRPASTVLWRIAAAVAPLATVALGPIVATSVLAWVLITGWSLVAAVLARKVAQDAWEGFDDQRGASEANALAVAMGFATFVLGAAPAFGGSWAGWLELVPVAIAASVWRQGPLHGPVGAKLVRFALASFAFATALVVVRLHVALTAAHVDSVEGLHAVVVSAFAAFALELRPRTKKAADGLSVLVVATQTLVLAPAYFAPAPAMVVAALIAMVTSARLARLHGPAEVPAARWLGPAYAFGYVAFQRIDQLVPPMVHAWFETLKGWLGYSVAPMPPSYDSVYAALFVLAVGLFAGFQLARATSEGQRARNSVLLTCTTWGAVVFGSLALVSLPTDVRPALLALPALLLTTAGLSFWHGRVDLARAAGLLAVATGVTFLQAWGEAWPVAMLALVAAVISVPSLRAQREAFSLASVVLVVLSVGAAFLGAAHLSQGLALVLASSAALLIARNVDDRRLLALASALPLLLVLRFGTPWLLGALAVLGVALLPTKARRTSRTAVLWPVLSIAAVVAMAWEALQHDAWPSLTLALGAAALIAGARRMRAAELAIGFTTPVEALGLLALLAALVPASWQFPWYLPAHTQFIAAAVALGCSVHAVRAQRSWQGVLLASGVVLLAMGCLPSVRPWELGAQVTSIVVLLATPALLASVTVPVAALLWSALLVDHPTWLVLPATLLSGLALFEELDLTWKWLLNRSRVAWAASLSAAFVLALAIALGADPVVVAGTSALLALVWTRANKEGSQLALGLGLAAAAALAPSLTQRGDASVAGWVQLAVPLLALVYGRVVLGLDRLVAMLGVRARESAQGSLLIAALASSLVTVAVQHGVESVAAAWVVALLFLGGSAVFINLIGAALVAALVPGLQLPVALALSALALAVHHAPSVALRVLGTSAGGRAKNEFLVATGSLAAVGLALQAAVLTGGVAAQLALAGTLGVAGVLLGLTPLVALAVLAAGLDLHASVVRVDLVLAPWSLAVAVMAAAVAGAARLETVSSRLVAVWRRLGPEPTSKLSTPFWWGAAGLVACSLPHASLSWGLVAALLLVTPSRVEAGVAFVLSAVLVVLAVPHEQAGLGLAVAGALFAWLGALRLERERVARAWFHAGWALALLGIGVVGPELGHLAVALTWAFGALTCWAVVRANPSVEWIGWSGTWLASHVVVAHVGLVLATGAPKELILPWLGLASAVLALVALLRTSPTSRGAGLALGAVSMFELVAALSVLDTPHVREAFVALAAGALVLAGAGRRAVKHDDGGAAWLGQGVVVVTLLALRRLGAGSAPGVLESWAALTWGPVLWGLARYLGRERRPQVSQALRGGAVAWPLVGLLCAPWDTPSQLVLLLLVQAGHYAWLARTGLRRTGATLSALTFNGAMVAAFFATGWHGVQDLALPLGLSIIALTRAFRDELSRDLQVRLRAVAMTAVYAAAAWRPLTFTTAWGLGFCLMVCIAGVAVGALMRIRSFVLLGTTFLVSAVLATLIRQGLSEPRLGAALLAALGLGIVAFMVVFTTRRAELQARMAALQTLFASWEG